MIVREEFQYKFKKQIQQIHYFSPCFEGGVVIIGLKSLGKDALYHFGKDNKLQYQHDFEDLVYSLAMMKDDEVITLEVPSNRIFILDLKIHQVRYYKYHYFQIDVSCQVDIEIFQETNLVCIRQNGAVNDNRLKLSYYRHPFEQEKKVNQLASTFEALQNQWNVDYTIKKGNNHSMILWFKQRQDDVFEIRMYDLEGVFQKEGGVQGKYRAYKIQNTLGVPFNIPKISCAVLNVWQMRKNVFMMHCLTDKTQLNLTNAHNIVINNFVWQVDSQVMRDSKIEFEAKFNNYQIDVCSSGPYSMFRTFYFGENGAMESPSLFVDNKSENILAKEMKKICELSKWMLPGYDQSLFVQGFFQNMDVTELKLSIRRITLKHLASFHILVNLGQQLDYDLMGETIKALDY